MNVGMIRHGAAGDVLFDGLGEQTGTTGGGSKGTQHRISASLVRFVEVIAEIRNMLMYFITFVIGRPYTQFEVGYAVDWS